MAREHARIEVLIWDDEDFLRLSESAQRLYFFLLSQEELTYAGLLPLRLRRWSSASSTSTVDGIAAALAELDASRFVVCDHDREEVLIRSLVRRDGIYKQPNVLAAALRESFEITSPVLRAALADELTRLPVEITGNGPAIAATALVAGLRTMPPALKSAVEARRKRTHTTPTPAAPAAAGQPPAEVDKARAEVDQARPAPAEDSPVPVGQDHHVHPAHNPSVNPSGKALGEGGRGLGLVFPLPKETTYVGGAPRAREHAPAPAREHARRLVAELLPGQPSRVTGPLAGEAARLLGEGIAPEHVRAGLRLWRGKRLSVRMLPELVGEAMRESEIAEASRPVSRTDQAVTAALEMARRFAIEDNDDTPFGRMLRGESGTDTGPVPWSALLSTSEPVLLGAAS